MSSSTFFETKGLLFKAYDVLAVHDHRLEALAQGESYVEGRHPIKTTVKAATYHQLKSKTTKESGQRR